MSLNNLYNFKNPVKNFLNIDALLFPSNVSSFDIEDLCWSEPFNFRVKKETDKYRTLRMPNILNFVYAYEYYKNLPNFGDIQNMDIMHKRLSANIDTGDFVTGEYDKQLEDDFNLLCVYDNLIKLDIKEYYGRIYTHYVITDGMLDRYLTNMNCGATNGLLMGNYLSLYFAEKNLSEISKDLNIELSHNSISCEFSYFSDDFYFFCNSSDNDKIILIFDKILEKYGLERSDNKKKIWTYETFNNYNVVERYWKKLIATCNKKYKKRKSDNKLVFINQLIYRLSQLQDEKLKKVFINNFYKTKYFRELDLEDFKVKDYDYHQLCFMMKFSPESMLYSIDKFSSMTKFENNNLHKFFEIRFQEALRNPFNEEQLYYYYSIKILGFNDILDKVKNYVLNSDNQILISYYLKDNIFSSSDKTILESKIGEQFWFQNYHLILYSPDLLKDVENSINKYLIPEANKPLTTDKPGKIATKCKRKITYMEFYKKNLLASIPIIRDITDVNSEIINYLNLKIAEVEADFESDDDD